MLTLFCLEKWQSRNEKAFKNVMYIYLEIVNKKKNITVNHFVNEKNSRRTVYSIIKKYEDLVPEKIAWNKID